MYRRLVEGERVAVEILNMAESFPAAALVSRDENGAEAGITMGTGGCSG